jgi:hypothetical protein
MCITGMQPTPPEAASLMKEQNHASRFPENTDFGPEMHEVQGRTTDYYNVT